MIGHCRTERRTDPRANAARAARSASCSAPASAISPSEVEDAVAIPYGELRLSRRPASPAMPGRWSSAASAARRSRCMAGRGALLRARRLRRRCAPALETLKALGIDDLILTNAAGSLREDMPPGSVMLITDHINFPATAIR